MTDFCKSCGEEVDTADLYEGVCIECLEVHPCENFCELHRGWTHADVDDDGVCEDCKKSDFIDREVKWIEEQEVFHGND